MNYNYRVRFRQNNKSINVGNYRYLWAAKLKVFFLKLYIDIYNYFTYSEDRLIGKLKIERYTYRKCNHEHNCHSVNPDLFGYGWHSVCLKCGYKMHWDNCPEEIFNT